MAKQSFKIEGLSELVDALADLSKATGKNVLMRALKKAGQPLADDAQRLAPRGETLRLSESISTGTKLSSRQKAKHKKESAVELFIGPSPSTKSITQEFGAAHHGPKPYMRPAWDANKTNAFDTIREDIKTETDKAAARASRKAARIAAKIKTT